MWPMRVGLCALGPSCTNRAESALCTANTARSWGFSELGQSQESPQRTLRGRFLVVTVISV